MKEIHQFGLRLRQNDREVDEDYQVTADQQGRSQDCSPPLCEKQA